MRGVPPLGSYEWIRTTIFDEKTGTEDMLTDGAQGERVVMDMVV